MPRPAAMPRSASRASPGPLTTQPMTATCSGMLRSSSAAWASLATAITSTSARPQLGHAIRSRPLRSRRPSVSSSCRPGARLLDRIGGEREADRVADALGEQRADAGGRLDQPAGRRTRLGHAEVQRVVDGLGQQPVRVDHHRHVRRLHRDLDVVEADLGEVGELALRRGDQRLGGRTAVSLRDVGIEAAGVHADADRQPAVLGLARRPS